MFHIVKILIFSNFFILKVIHMQFRTFEKIKNINKKLTEVFPLKNKH